MKKRIIVTVIAVAAGLVAAVVGGMPTGSDMVTTVDCHSSVYFSA